MSTVNDFIQTHIKSEIDRINERLKAQQKAINNSNRLCDYLVENFEKIAELDHRKYLLKQIINEVDKLDHIPFKVQRIDDKIEELLEESHLGDKVWTKNWSKHSFKARAIGRKEGSLQVAQSLQVLMEKIETIGEKRW